MNKKLGIIFTSFLLQTALAEAAITFSEIMYDPEGSDSGREWVEVRNDGDTVTLTNYKLFESNTNHGITAFQGGSSIPSGGFAVIADNPAKFLADFPDYKGLLFDSSFSLSNAGEFIALKDSALATLDSLTYSPSLGGGDDSTTLSLLSGSWGRGDATPGVDNTLSTKALGGAASSTKSTQVTALTSGPAPDLTVFVPEERLVIAGADTLFTASALSGAGTEPQGLSYEWSFGDGGARTGKSVTYRYSESGFYVAVIDVSNGVVFAKNRLRVRAVEPSIFVTKVEKSMEKVSVTVSNPSPYELDIGSWKINNNGAYYSLPKNTILLPRASTTLNALELGMATATAVMGTTSIYFPGGQLLASSTFIPEIYKKNENTVISPGNVEQSKKLYAKNATLDNGTSRKEKIKNEVAIYPLEPAENHTNQLPQKDRKIGSFLKTMFANFK